jgi:hypothetical protein
MFLGALFGDLLWLMVERKATEAVEAGVTLGLPTRCNERVTLASSAAILLETCFHAFKGSRASV